MNTIIENPALLVPIILSLLGLFSGIARLTPNDSDDKWVAWVWKWVNRLGLRGGSVD